MITKSGPLYIHKRERERDTHQNTNQVVSIGVQSCRALLWSCRNTDNHLFTRSVQDSTREGLLPKERAFRNCEAVLELNGRVNEGEHILTLKYLLQPSCFYSCYVWLEAILGQIHGLVSPSLQNRKKKSALEGIEGDNIWVAGCSRWAGRSNLRRSTWLFSGWLST